MRPDESGYVQIGSELSRLIHAGEVDPDGCIHFAEINDVVPSADGCEDCLRIGDEWVHLRLCLICGHVGCCDDSKNKHASQHYHDIGHPVIVSYEPEEGWLWCYQDQVGIDPWNTIS